MDTRDRETRGRRLAELSRLSGAAQATSGMDPLRALQALPPTRSLGARLMGLAIHALAAFGLISLGAYGLERSGLFDSPLLSDVPDSRLLHPYGQQEILSGHWDRSTSQVWLGTTGGLEIYDPRTRLWRSLLHPEGFGGPFPVRWISQGDRGVFFGDGRGAVLFRANLHASMQTFFGRTGIENLRLDQAGEIAATPSEILIPLGRSLTIYDRIRRSWSVAYYSPGEDAWREGAPHEQTPAEDAAAVYGAAYVPSEDTCYIGTAAGIFRRRQNQWLRGPHPDQAIRTPVLHLVSHGDRLYFLVQGEQGSLRLGRWAQGQPPELLLSPSRLAGSPEWLTDAARLDNFVFLSSSKQFLRVFNLADHSWEALAFSETGHAPDVRALEIFDRKLWLATDRGLLLFRSPQNLWKVGREAQIPIFHGLLGSASPDWKIPGTSETGVGIRKFTTTPGHEALYVITERHTLGRIEAGSETLDWLFGPSLATYSVPDISTDIGVPLKETEILGAWEIPAGILVGTQHGILHYRYDRHTWEQYEPKRFHEHKVHALERDPASGQFLVVHENGVQFPSGVTLKHPSDDVILKLASATGRVFYTTLKGELGLVSPWDSQLVPLVDPGVCPAAPHAFTTAAISYPDIYFGTNGGGIAVYDSAARRWKHHWTAQTESAGGALLSDRMREVRVGGPGVLAYRTFGGGVGHRHGNDPWRALIGETSQPTLKDEDFTAAAAAKDGVLWLGMPGILTAYDPARHSWLPPLHLDDRSEVARLEVAEEKPAALTAAGTLFLERRRIAHGVTAFASNGKELLYISDHRLHSYPPGSKQESERFTRLPPGFPIVDVAESDPFFFAASAAEVWAYDKQARRWQKWGNPTQGTIAELVASENEGVLALMSGGNVYRRGPVKPWEQVSPKGQTAKHVFTWEGRNYFLAANGLLVGGSRETPRSDLPSPKPLLGVFEVERGLALVQEDAVRFYDLEAHQWWPAMEAPEGKKIRAAAGGQSLWSMTSDGVLYAAPLPAKTPPLPLQKVFDPESPARPCPLDGLVDAVRFGDRLYLAQPDKLSVYDIRLHRWLPPLVLSGPGSIARLLCSERFLAIVSSDGKIFLSTELFEGAIPHENLQRDWTELSHLKANDFRAMTLNAAGHFFLLTPQHSVVEHNPFTRTTTEVLLRQAGPSGQSENTSAQAADQEVRDLAVEGKTLWLGTHNGLWAYSIAEKPPRFLAHHLSEQPMKKLLFRPGWQSLAEASNGRVWRRESEADWRELPTGRAGNQELLIHENALWRWVRRPQSLSIVSAHPDIPLLDESGERFSFDRVLTVQPWKDGIVMASEKMICLYPVDKAGNILDPEKMQVFPIPGVTKFSVSHGRLLAISARETKAYQFEEGQWLPASLPGEPDTETLVETDFWRWERKGGEISGFLRSHRGQEIPMDLAALGQRGQFPFDQVLAAAVLPESEALWLSTFAGLLCRTGKDHSLFPVKPASEFYTAPAASGATQLYGQVDGKILQFDGNISDWVEPAEKSSLVFQRLRIHSPLWTWQKSADKVTGRFQDAPDTPIWVESPSGISFSFDDVWDARWFGGEWWVASSAGPISLPPGRESFNCTRLKLARTGPVHVLKMQLPAGGGPKRLLARSKDIHSPLWRYDPERGSWNVERETEPRATETLVDEGRWVFELERGGQGPRPATLRKWLRGPSGRKEEFRITRGRCSFDDVHSIAVTEKALWLAAGEGFVHYPLGAKGSVDPLRFDYFRLPGRPSIRQAKLAMRADGLVALCQLADSSEVSAFRFDEAKESWEKIQLPDANQLLQRFDVLRNPFWTWSEIGGDSDSPALEGFLHYADGTQRPLLLKEGRFPFDRFYSTFPEGEAVWLSTDAGIARCPLDGQSLPLDSMRLHPAAGPGGQFLEVRPAGHADLEPGLYWSGERDAVLRYDPAVSRWKAVSDAPPALTGASGKEILVGFNGFWRWWRPLGFDPRAEQKKPAVQIDSLDSTGRWTPLAYKRGRFSFDNILDVAVHEGYLWAATEAGLCRYVNHPTALDLSQARIFPDLAEASDLAVNRANNELFIRLRENVREAYSLSMPHGKPHKAEGGRNPLRVQVRSESALYRWLREEVYDGSVLSGHRAQLEIRDARGGWQPLPLTQDILPVDAFRNLTKDLQVLWLATPAGMVAYDLAQSGLEEKIRFYPETGDTRRVLLKETEGGGRELLCLSQQGPRELVYRFHPEALDGKNWREVEDSNIFRRRILEDGPWHWFRERHGHSILWRGLAQRPRPIESGRFTDEIVLAAAASGSHLYAYTPLGLLRYRIEPAGFGGSGPALALEATLDPAGSSKGIPPGRLPASILATSQGLLLALPDGVYVLQMEKDSDRFSVSEHWQLPVLPAPPARLQLLVEPAAGAPVLQIRGGSGDTAYYREYWIESSAGGLRPLDRRLPGAIRCYYDPAARAIVLEPGGRGGHSGAGGASPVSAGLRSVTSIQLEGTPVGLLNGGDRLWVVQPHRLRQLQVTGALEEE